MNFVFIHEFEPRHIYKFLIVIFWLTHGMFLLLSLLLLFVIICFSSALQNKSVIVLLVVGCWLLMIAWGFLNQSARTTFPIGPAQVFSMVCTLVSMVYSIVVIMPMFLAIMSFILMTMTWICTNMLRNMPKIL